MARFSSRKQRPLKGFLLALLGIGLSACTGVQERLERMKPPQVQLSHLALLQADLLNPVFRVGLQLKNPNAESLRVESADAVLELNGKTVAKGRSAQALELLPNQSSEVELDVHAKTLALARQLFRLEQDGQIDYTVAGHLQLTKWLGGLGSLPFRLSGQVTREQLLQELEGMQRR